MAEFGRTDLEVKEPGRLLAGHAGRLAEVLADAERELAALTGRVTGPHLHWVARYGSVTVDPSTLLELGPARREP